MRGFDPSAVRVALWRALHRQVDRPPFIIEDELGLRIAGVGPDWRNRPDMNLERSGRTRSSIVARARYVEDAVSEQLKKGVDQYVILGAGLDTLALRRPDLMTKLSVFEIDQPDTQNAKRARLKELGLSLPERLHFVAVNFESGESWVEKLESNGFDPRKPAVFSSLGVAMYLTQEAIAAKFKAVAELAKGSVLIMSYIMPFDQLEAELRPGMEMAAKSAAAESTPFRSFFLPSEILQLAQQCGLKNTKVVTANDLKQLYFSNRSDDLTLVRGEELLVASVD